jgi:hypothetical protein
MWYSIEAMVYYPSLTLTLRNPYQPIHGKVNDMLGIYRGLYGIFGTVYNMDKT